jgi:large subunit ribosomal protein L1
MAQEGKRTRSNRKLIDAQRKYGVDEAFSLLKTIQSAKFDETVEVAIRLGVDAKKSDQMVRGVAKLPHGSGRSVRILVFAKGEKVEEAKAAGADYAGGDELIEQIKGGWLDFDKAIATPDMMPKIGAIAKILGPRGLMPNPKVGTVTVDVAKAVTEEKEGRVEFRIEKAGVIHAAIGKRSFEAAKLADNFHALVEQVARLKPASAKGNYFLSVAISSTMGPGIKLDPSKIMATASKG